MRTVLDVTQVIHVWANKSQSHARTPSNNVFFDGKILYSYGHHYPMGCHLSDDLTLINSTSSTVTTNKHKSYVRQATRHLNCVFVPTNTIKSADYYERYKTPTYKAELLGNIEGWIRSEFVSAANSVAKRKKAELKEDDINHALYEFSQAEKLLAHFKLKMPAKLIKLAETLKADASAIVAINAKELAAAKKKREKQQKLEQAKREKEALEAVPLWLAGNSDYKTLSLMRIKREALLRIEGDEIATSHGARFPLDQAIKAFPMVRKMREYGVEWKRTETTGQVLTLGAFRIDRIYKNGNVEAGCHFVPWEAIEHVARILNIYP